MTSVFIFISFVAFCLVLTEYLEAQRAHITDLRVVNIATESADIAYHLDLTQAARRRPNLEEGDVIAFLANAKTGQTEIEKLSYENSGRALMAGVISRSAYIYAHAPRHDVEKGKVKQSLRCRRTHCGSRGPGSSTGHMSLSLSCFCAKQLTPAVPPFTQGYTTVNKYWQIIGQPNKNARGNPVQSLKSFLRCRGLAHILDSLSSRLGSTPI